MTDVISMALGTGLGPVIGIIIIVTMMGITYKIAGRVPAVLVGIATTFTLMYIDFLPVFWGATIIFGIIAGLIFGTGSGGEEEVGY